jgi:hypothetical protein
MTSHDGAKVDAAEAPGAGLTALLGPGTPAADLARGFADLQRLVMALPLSSDEYCFAINWLTSAADLARAGDWNAAAYQVALVLRKLRHGGYAGVPTLPHLPTADD